MTYDELHALYQLPLFDLLKKSREVHEAHWPENEVQLCTLLSIKTGGCSEDCSYCAQSARYKSGVEADRLMECDDVLARARAARENGSTRFCMGAAWRGVRSGTKRFEQVLDIVREVSDLGMEVCVTLGQLGPEEAAALKEAGVTAYNHNIDTSREHYPEIVTTHTFDDRLQTIRNVQDAGMSVCCGGILGLGETTEDRLKMIEVISSFNPPPESIPINKLMPMPGTPMAENQGVDTFELVRIIAVTRLAVPGAKVRLSAGRTHLSEEAQALCFFAGANSIFYGDKLLTAANPAVEKDLNLIARLGLSTQQPNRELPAPPAREDQPLQPALPEAN
ncbi:biotin synthase BioB [Roseibacillus ishigakijimensis]|uniref:Biotin synthase n=1 Tax=Roseibacillus ishigakijimensis TaxID=454146 RepID=A0A934RNT6_9BACT|nr:biotin synthase BioB [Roseibacillus ishigakijimensis]MBK1834794.1 biotin synthase BioB [Roseibacillus ishigakijimensis]